MNILITGCNSGFGYYTTEYFAAAGHTVFATVREGANIQRLEQLAATDGYAIELVQLEVTDSVQIAKVRDYVLSKGPLDVLVNNAGRVVIAPYEEIPEHQIREIFEVNVFGLSNMIQAFLPSMREQKSGTIVNLSSPIAVVPSHWYGVYAASKAAVNALSKTLALELADWNIRVIVVYPGNFKTEVLHNAVGDLTISEKSPYFDLKQKTKQASREIYANFLQSGGEDRASHETGRPVGEAVLNAVFDGTDNIHYPVGSDAEGVWAHRMD